MRKYGNASVWRAFTDLFDYFPIAATVEGQVRSCACARAPPHALVHPCMPLSSLHALCARRKPSPTSAPLTRCCSLQVLCMHGGLSPGVSSISELQDIDRFQEVPTDGVVSDLVWSDPVERMGWHINSRGGLPPRLPHWQRSQPWLRRSGVCFRAGRDRVVCALERTRLCCAGAPVDHEGKHCAPRRLQRKRR